jgi:hypothetical protein
MTKARHVPVIGVLLIAVLCPVARVSAEQRPAIAVEIANAYGLQSLGQVDAIRYTFHLDAPGPGLKWSRSWVWEPNTDRVSYDGKDKAGNPVKVTYSRSQLATQSEMVKKEIEFAFLNDQYNLVFPFHLVWDTGAKVENIGMHKLPAGKGSARRVVVTYPAQGGFTPGDVWELFVGSDNRIREMIYRKGGDAKPTLTLSWQDHKKFGPLLIALDHRGKSKGKPARVWFTDVAVKLAGSNDWVTAH